MGICILFELNKPHTELLTRLKYQRKQKTLYFSLAFLREWINKQNTNKLQNVPKLERNQPYIIIHILVDIPRFETQPK